MLAVQGIDHLAIGSGLERVVRAQALLQLAMVVDLAIHGERQFAIRRTDGLRAAGRINDGQALMHEQRRLVLIHAAPVRAAMPLPLGEFKGKPAQGNRVILRLQSEHSENGAHGPIPLLM